MRVVRVALAALLLAVGTGHAGADTAADLFSGFQSKSNDPVQVDAQLLEVFEEGKERISLFSGNVVVKRGDTTLRAASIRLHQDLQGKTDAFTKIEAEGGISVRSKDQMLTGKAAVVDMKTNTIVVSGGVELSQGANKLTGTRLVVDLATGRARIEGDTVRGVFTPGGP
jgi:lipopolysaccharide export system protein LptA